MALDCLLFLRDEPDLDGYVVKPYTPTDGDVLAVHPWRDEIRWVVRTSRRGDDFDDVMETLGDRYRGALWDAADKKLTWYWWDRGALEARALAWKVEELTTWLLHTRGDSGPREQVIGIAVRRLSSFSETKKKRALAMLMWEDRDELEEDVRSLLADLMLEMPTKGDALFRAVKETLEDEPTHAPKLPSSREELAALYASADRDTSARRKLRQAIDEYGEEDTTAARAAFATFILDEARAGAAKPKWLTIEAWPGLDAAPERADRAAFAARGSLAKALVRLWNEADEYAATVNDLLERRRRGGERFAGIPDDIRALAVAGRYEEAFAEYARRYQVSPELAREVVNMNA